MEVTEVRDTTVVGLPTQSHLVRLSHVHKYYGGAVTGVHALHDINLRIEPGEMVSVCGPSGSGKSSLLNLVGMLEAPTEGDLVLAGQSVAALPEQARAALRNDMMGFVFQSFSLIPVMNARENVMLPLLLRGHLDAAQLIAAEVRAGELLAQLGLASQVSHYPPRLDPSQCQRVAVARALIAAPRLVIADEPVSRLDSGYMRMVMDLFARQQRDFGTAFLISTRDQRQFNRAIRTLQLSDGRLLASEGATTRRPVRVQL